MKALKNSMGVSSNVSDADFEKMVKTALEIHRRWGDEGIKEAAEYFKSKRLTKNPT
jgi:hypothetical protein